MKDFDEIRFDSFFARVDNGELIMTGTEKMCDCCAFVGEEKPATIFNKAGNFCAECWVEIEKTLDGDR